MIAIICAMARNRVIGHHNEIPWHLPEDMKHFKETTMGHAIVMGRKTFESIGRPLPGRKNIVVTRDPQFQAEGVETCSDLQKAIETHRADGVFIIGGSQIYEQTLPLCDTLHLTLIDRDYEGDSYFPEVDLENSFTIVQDSKGLISEKEGIPYRFITATRN